MIRIFVIALLIIISFQNASAQAPLSAKTLRFDDLLKIPLQQFKDYLKDLGEKEQPKKEEDRLLYFESSASTRLRFSIRMERKSEGEELTETLFFLSKGIPAGRMMVRRVGKDLEPWTLDDLAKGGIPNSNGCKEFEINWDPFQFRVFYTKDGTVTRYNFNYFDGLVIIEGDEIILEDKSISRSRLIYRGKQAGPELEAIMVSAGPGQWEAHEFFKPDLNDLDAKDFTRSYLQIVTGPMNQLNFQFYTSTVQKLNWPLIK
jgi:hypothetical protein